MTQDRELKIVVIKNYGTGNRASLCEVTNNDTTFSWDFAETLPDKVLKQSQKFRISESDAANLLRNVYVTSHRHDFQRYSYPYVQFETGGEQHFNGRELSFLGYVINKIQDAADNLPAREPWEAYANLLVCTANFFGVKEVRFDEYISVKDTFRFHEGVKRLFDVY